MELLNLLIGGGLFAFIQFLLEFISNALGRKDKTTKAIEKLSEQIQKLLFQWYCTVT